MKVEDEWKSFVKACFPATIGRQQYIDLRRTFYGGAAMVYFALMNMLEPGEDPTEADLAKMRAFHNELMAFNDDVKAGRA